MTGAELTVLKLALRRLDALAGPAARPEVTLSIRNAVMPLLVYVLKSPRERTRFDQEMLVSWRRELAQQREEMPEDLPQELVELLKDAVLQKPGWRQAASTRLAQIGVPNPPRPPI